jgi:toxin CcdB
MRFDVYAIPRGAVPYVVDVQSDFLSYLASRMIIPIIPAENLPKRIADLHPLLHINGDRHVLVTHQLTSISKRDLKIPVASLEKHRDEITRALDILFTGF